MSLALIALCVWVVAATGIGVLPMRYHWRGAIGLMATGAPVLGWIFWVHGLWIGAICIVAMGSILRWPALFLIRRMARLFGRRRAG